MYQIEFKSSVKKDLKNIDKSKIRIILTEIEKLKSGIEDNEHIIKLKGNNPYYRFRISDYRVVFEKFEEKLIILVVKIGHRKDIYKRLP